MLHPQVEQFFSKMNVGSGQRALEQSLETIRLNIHWVRENDVAIHDWLKNYLNTWIQPIHIIKSIFNGMIHKTNITFLG